jgi:hypothetical protein
MAGIGRNSAVKYLQMNNYNYIITHMQTFVKQKIFNYPSK